jgi:hypothetical protein
MMVDVRVGLSLLCFGQYFWREGVFLALPHNMPNPSLVTSETNNEESSRPLQL